MTRSFTDSVIEDATFAWLGGLGYAVLHGPEVACKEPGEGVAQRIVPAEVS